MSKLLLKCVAGDVYWEDELDLEADEARTEKYFKHLDECPYHQAIAENSFKEFSKQLKAYNLAFGATEKVITTENQILMKEETTNKSEYSLVVGNGVKVIVAVHLCGKHPIENGMQSFPMNAANLIVPKAAEDKKTLLPIKSSRSRRKYIRSMMKANEKPERTLRNISYAVELKDKHTGKPNKPNENRSSKDLYEK